MVGEDPATVGQHAGGPPAALTAAAIGPGRAHASNSDGQEKKERRKPLPKPRTVGTVELKCVRVLAIVHDLLAAVRTAAAAAIRVLVVTVTQTRPDLAIVQELIVVVWMKTEGTAAAAAVRKLIVVVTWVDSRGPFAVVQLPQTGQRLVPAVTDTKFRGGS